MTRRLACRVACCIVLAGCAADAVDLAPARPDRPWAPVTGGAGEILPSPGTPAAVAPAGGFVLPANSALPPAPPAPEIDMATPLGLTRLIDIAQRHNPRTRIAWNEARKAALAAGISEATYLPRIILSAVGGRASTGQQQQSLAGVSGSLDTNAAGSGGVGALSLQWLLFDFGERAALREAMRQGAMITNIAFTAAHQQLIHAVSLAYYVHAAATTRTMAADEALANARLVQAAAEGRQQRGIGTVVEVAQARQAVAQARLNQVQAQGAQQDARMALLSAMGLSPLTAIRIADGGDTALPTGLGPAAEQAIAAALARRPDMLGAYAAQKAALAQVEAARAAFAPKVFLSATGSYNIGQLGISAIPSIGQQLPTMNLSNNALGGSVLAGVTLPIYDGGTRLATLAQARATAENAASTLEQLRTEATRQIASADNALQTAIAAQAAAREARAAAQTTYTAAFDAYRAGLGSVTDVTVAQTQLLAARTAVAESRAAALSASVTLALATGALGAAPP